MRLFLTGVSCAGKSTTGAVIAEFLGVKFFDLDLEIEAFFNTSIERLQKRCFNMHGYRNEAAKALEHLLARQESTECVIALPPAGLMGGYLRVLKKNNGIRVVITDEPENILERLRFYDIDSRPIEKVLSQKERALYLRELKKDMTYFRKSYERADLQVDISGLDPVQAAHKIIESVNAYKCELHCPASTISNTIADNDDGDLNLFDPG
ncbi:MAG: hypothetical protein JW989_07775 [Chlorobiaceae bacterium]|jgi:shikimate kinase|nr:hypothetical protein [Chlorobiaceae bacterium]